MKKSPKISIVIPSYNQGQFIEQTITSILDQQYPEIELIIIDGGSNDNTIDIIKKYERYINYWISEPDRGQSHAINKGLAYCTGEIFNWINSDDFSEKGALAHIGEEYSKQPFVAICGKVNVWDTTTFSHVRDTSYIGNTTEDSIANYNMNQEGTYWAMSAFRELQGVNESLHYVMDLDLWLRAHIKFPISSFRKSQNILSNFRRHNEAKSTINSILDKFESRFTQEISVVYDQFLPSKVKISSYRDILPVSKPDYVTPSNVSLCEEMKERITGLFMYKLIREYFYSGRLKQAKALLKYIRPIEPIEHKRDLQYIRKKMLLKGYLV